MRRLNSHIWMGGQILLDIWLTVLVSTKLLCVGYGLSPNITNLLNPDDLTTLRMMTGKVDGSTTPKIQAFLSTATKLLDFKVLSDALIDTACDKWPASGHVFKFNVLKDTNVEKVNIMRFTPVLFVLVQDGLDRDLDDGLILERLSALDNDQDNAYIQHASHFYKACLVQNQANLRKPALDTAAFTAWASPDNKCWEKLPLVQFCPELVHQQVASRALAESNMDVTTILKLLLEHNRANLAHWCLHGWHTMFWIRVSNISWRFVECLACGNWQAYAMSWPFYMRSSTSCWSWCHICLIAFA